jgi:hypothetical protein
MVDQLLNLRQIAGSSQVGGTPVNLESIRTDQIGRLIQITLAIYLIPVLLVVVVVSGIGMMILGISETIYELGAWVKRMLQSNGTPSSYRC